MSRLNRPIPVTLEAVFAEGTTGSAAGVLDFKRPPHATTLDRQDYSSRPQNLHTEPEAAMTEIRGGSHIGLRPVLRP